MLRIISTVMTMILTRLIVGSSNNQRTGPIGTPILVTRGNTVKTYARAVVGQFAKVARASRPLKPRASCACHLKLTQYRSRAVRGSHSLTSLLFCESIVAVQSPIMVALLFTSLAMFSTLAERQFATRVTTVVGSWPPRTAISTKLSQTTQRRRSN